MQLEPEEIELLEANPLFSGFKREDIVKALYCLRANKKSFTKDSFLFQEGDKADFAVLLLKGKVDLVRYGVKGDSSIVESFSKGESFGEAYASIKDGEFGVSGLAKEDGTALFIWLRPLLDELSCPYGQKLMKNLVGLLAQKDLLMNHKLNVLSQKGLKGKVMEYLLGFAKGKRNVFFKVSFSRQEMADYLGCDRSALSRLLSQMKEEGLIDYSEKKFLIK
jgi:CRP-like cAMP-binding protein